MNLNEKIGRGNTADIYLYDNKKVLKLFYSNFDKSTIKYEYQISKFAYNNKINTPKPFKVVEVNGRIGIIYEFLPCKPLLETIIKKPWKIFQKINKIATMHHRINKLEAPGYFKNQKEYLNKNIDKADKLTISEKRAIKNILISLKSGNKVCHGDYHLENILSGADEYIIDWMTGISGNPAGDIARSLMILDYGVIPDDASMILKMINKPLRILIKQIYLNKYKEISDINLHEIKKWFLPVAAARLTEAIPENEKRILLKLIKSSLKTE
ncbi:MAG TPA: phosphotransferase [Candidatus Mcinerneyibacterium sp.]|nr:phosphotransferase [Candidatus Mcinerneyibacterium sp.]